MDEDSVYVLKNKVALLSVQVATLKEELEEKDQTIAELEEQINETPTEPYYAR